MAFQCAYCGTKTNAPDCGSTTTSVSDYGQKKVKECEAGERFCGEICIRAMNKTTLKSKIKTHLTLLRKEYCPRDTHKVNHYISQSVAFLKGQITRKQFLDVASSSLDDATEAKDENFLQWVCYTQQMTVTLEQMMKQYKVKL